MTELAAVPVFTRVAIRPGIQRTLPQVAARKVSNPTVAPDISTASPSTKSHDRAKDFSLAEPGFTPVFNLSSGGEHELLNSLAGFYFALVKIPARV